MSWDEGRLLALEIDANYGLAPTLDTSRAVLRDPSVWQCGHAQHISWRSPPNSPFSAPATRTRSTAPADYPTH